MPPIKVYLQVALIALAGLWIAGFLVLRLGRSLRNRKAEAMLGYALALLAFAALGWGLAAAFIPCFPGFGSALCQGPSREKWIALTFDDGPNEPFTSQILDILEAKQVPAAFFTLGNSISRNPEVVARMRRSGFTVGNHTQDHRPLWNLSSAEIASEIESWERAMAPFGIPSPKLFRSPHGWKSPFLSKILEDKGYRLIGWTRGVWDTDNPGEEVLLSRITARPTPGMILLLHDGINGVPGADRSQLVRVLPRIIDDYRAQGFRFVSLGEMLP
ncbi:MAG: polysaccharide deacetylase family protein [bacterium]